ncbi:MAG TPA: hypothetical protein VD965_14225 [Burkholderiales bacterium]|nr:hypothetical protein [Burkholderiales bacterium]
MRLLLAIVIAACAAPVLAQGSNPMSWPLVQKQLQEHWKATYPTEKVLKIEPKGGVVYYATERKTESDWWGDSRVIEKDGQFARQGALVTVERANRTQARFEVAALFQKPASAWQFRQIVVGKVEDLTAAKAGDLPSPADAARIFTAAWKKTRPDFDVHSIEVLKSEPRAHQDRRWVTYHLAITATGTDKGSKSMFGKRYRCTPSDFSSVLKLDGGSWVADEKMIANINEAGECKPI